LYVEDDDAVWEATRQSLAEHCELLRARNSREVFRKVSALRFDLILMDVVLADSELSGIEITRHLTKRTCAEPPAYAAGVHVDTPIVYVTSYSHNLSLDALFESGAADVVTKPVRPNYFTLLLSRLSLGAARNRLIGNGLFPRPARQN
jgi:CheY-like chemotaxis protein